MSDDYGSWWSRLVKRSAADNVTAEYLAWCEIKRLTTENERFRRALNELAKVGYANTTRMAMAYRALNGEEKDDA